MENREKETTIREAVEKAVRRERSGRSSRKNLLLIVGVLLGALVLREAGLIGGTDGGATLPEVQVAEIAAMLQEAPLVTHLGNSGGETVVIAFLDYSGGHNRRMATEIDDFLAANAAARIAVVELPAADEVSLAAARHALAASLQGAWPAFHRVLMVSTLPLTNDGFRDLGAALGLDRDRLAADAASATVDGALAHNRALASAAGIDGTPAFVIGDQLFVGFIDAANLAELVSRLHTR